MRRNTHCRDCALILGSWRQIGEANPFWNGGRTRHKEGYAYILNPARFDGDTRRYIAEHVYIVEQERGSRLPKGWHVHHLNGIKDDNRRENLMAMSASEHHRNHHEPWEARIRQLETRLRELEKLEIRT